MLTAFNNKNNPFSSIFEDNEINIVLDIQNTNTMSWEINEHEKNGQKIKTQSSLEKN